MRIEIAIYLYISQFSKITDTEKELLGDLQNDKREAVFKFDGLLGLSLW